jgi:hypothetical protein
VRDVTLYRYVDPKLGPRSGPGIDVLESERVMRLSETDEIGFGKKDTITITTDIHGRQSTVDLGDQLIYCVDRASKA